MSLPIRTPEERADDLLKAAAARAKRSGVKTSLKHGTTPLAEVIYTQDETIGKMKVSAVLQAMPGVGKIRAGQIMGRLGIAENRRVRGLGDNQRAALKAEFETVPA